MKIIMIKLIKYKMLTKLLSFHYRVRKTKVLDQNKISLLQYKRNLTETRKAIKAEAQQYYHQAENQFLQQHMERTKRRHQQNIEKFRKSVVNISYSLYNSLQGFQRATDVKNQKIEKYIRNEEVKSLNRERIKKIISHEAQEYWFSGEKIKHRLDSNLFFPPYLGSTDYYHKLYSEAMLYEMLDFESLQKTASTSYILDEKNKQLIPLYKNICEVIFVIKNDEIVQIEKKHQLRKIKISERYSDNVAKMNSQLLKAEKEFEEEKAAIVANFKNKQWREEKIIERIRNLLYLFKLWKEYTTVLSLTTVQTLKMIKNSKKEEAIERLKEKLVVENEKRQNLKSVSAVEEDTDEEKESDLEAYMIKNQPPIKKQKSFKFKQSDESELETLFQEQEKIKEQVMSEIEQYLMDNEIQTPDIKLDYEESMNVGTDMVPKSFQVGKSLRNDQETTSTVELLKQNMEEREEVVELLNQLGEVIIEYPRLFKKIWDRGGK